MLSFSLNDKEPKSIVFDDGIRRWTLSQTSSMMHICLNSRSVDENKLISTTHTVVLAYIGRRRTYTMVVYPVRMSSSLLITFFDWKVHASSLTHVLFTRYGLFSIPGGKILNFREENRNETTYLTLKPLLLQLGLPLIVRSVFLLCWKNIRPSWMSRFCTMNKQLDQEWYTNLIRWSDTYQSKKNRFQYESSKIRKKIVIVEWAISNDCYTSPTSSEIPGRFFFLRCHWPMA